MRIDFLCDYCGRPSSQKRSQYIRKKRHFCNRDCYSLYRTEILPADQQNAWQGGVSPQESHRRWAEKNRDKLKAMAKARQMRELNAPGSHTKEEWEQVKAQYKNRCAHGDETCHGPITKDHIVALINGGSQDASNLQPLCRSHNSRKSRKISIQFDGFE